MYEFLTDTYETERLKVLSVWSMFRDEDLSVRPHTSDARGRSVHEQMVHQCVSENFWFLDMLQIGVSVDPLPDPETRLGFVERYAATSAERLDVLRSESDAWWEGETRFFDTTRSRAWVMVRRIAHTSHHRGQRRCQVDHWKSVFPLVVFGHRPRSAVTRHHVPFSECPRAEQAVMHSSQ